MKALEANADAIEQELGAAELAAVACEEMAAAGRIAAGGGLLGSMAKFVGSAEATAVSARPGEGEREGEGRAGGRLGGGGGGGGGV
jgi:hypothetical protein